MPNEESNLKDDMRREEVRGLSLFRCTSDRRDKFQLIYLFSL